MGTVVAKFPTSLFTDSFLWQGMEEKGGARINPLWRQNLHTCSFKKMKEMLSSLLLRKLSFERSKDSAEEDDKEQSCVWTRGLLWKWVSECAPEQDCCLQHLWKGGRAPVPGIKKSGTKLLPNSFPLRFWSKGSSKQPQNMDLWPILLPRIQNLSSTEKSLTLQEQEKKLQDEWQTPQLAL